MARQGIMIPKSHFTHVLHTNYAPSKEELKELQNLVVQPKERIRKLEEEIARLQAARDELQHFVDSHCALLTPIRRLPADVLGEIFVHCLPNNRHNLALCTVKEAPLLLTTICRTWREVALSTPRLWSSVHISISRPRTQEVSSYHQRLQAKMLQGIKLWLSRSGSRPLTLSIHTPTNASPMTHTHFNELVDVIKEHSAHWKILLLGPGVIAPHQHSFVGLAAENLPLLERIYAGDSNLFSQPGSQFPQPLILDRSPVANLLSNLPSLRALHVKGSFATLGIPLGWDRLTELHFIFQSPGMSSQSSAKALLRAIAQHCHSLVVLTFRTGLSLSEVGITDPTMEDETSLTDPIEYANLRELNIFLVGAVLDHRVQNHGRLHGSSFPFLPYLKDVCGSIIMPELLRLSIQIGDGITQRSASDDILPFQSMVEGSPRLEHLWVGGYYILKPEAFSRCLCSSQSLKTLTLHPERISALRYGNLCQKDKYMSPAPNWVPEFLSYMNALGSCPQLEVLDMGRCGQYDNLDSILEFVQSESRISKLKDVKVDVGDLSRDQIRAMTESVDAGPMQVARSLREVHGISVDLRWNEAEPPRSPEYEPLVPYAGLPQNHWEGAGLW